MSKFSNAQELLAAIRVAVVTNYRRLLELEISDAELAAQHTDLEPAVPLFKGDQMVVACKKVFRIFIDKIEQNKDTLTLEAILWNVSGKNYDMSLKILQAVMFDNAEDLERCLWSGAILGILESITN